MIPNARSHMTCLLLIMCDVYIASAMRVVFNDTHYRLEKKRQRYK